MNNRYNDEYANDDNITILTTMIMTKHHHARPLSPLSQTECIAHTDVFTMSNLPMRVFQEKLDTYKYLQFVLVGPLLKCQICAKV